MLRFAPSAPAASLQPYASAPLRFTFLALLRLCLLPASLRALLLVQGLGVGGRWHDLRTSLCTFRTVEDFMLFWKHSPKITVSNDC